MKKILLLLMLIGTFHVAQATTFNSDGSQSNIQSLHDNSSCHDWDTITIPSGTLHWSTFVTLSKRVIIAGNSVVNSDGPPYTHTDNTTIIDDRPSTSDNGLFKITGNGGCRLTGMSFKPGTAPQRFCGIEIDTTGDPITSAIRVDNNYFGDLNWSPNIVNFNTYNFAVIDHNVSDCNHGMVLNYPGRYGLNNNNDGGDYTWGRPPGLGGAEFVVLENNKLRHGGDCSAGGKNVYRYNDIRGDEFTDYDVNGEIVTHGIGRSQGNFRGCRANEVYGNRFFWSRDGAKDLDGCDGGTYYIWGNELHNVYGGVNKPLGVFATNYYRMTHIYDTPFLGCDGFNKFDEICTDAACNHVEGNNGYVFYSGTTGSGTNQGTVVDSGSPGWTPTDKWKGYIASNTVSGGANSGIGASNTNTLTIYNSGFTENWASGLAYKIGKVIRPLDPPSGGQSGTINRSVPSHPTQALEPLYSYNNVCPETGQHMNWGVPAYLQPYMVSGVNYFNDTAMPGYTPYTYPHPLISNGSVITIDGFPANAHHTTINISWTRAVSSTVDVYRDSTFLTNTANDGAYHSTGAAPDQTHTFKVCEAGTSACSRALTIPYP